MKKGPTMWAHFLEESYKKFGVVFFIPQDDWFTIHIRERLIGGNPFSVDITVPSIDGGWASQLSEISGNAAILH